jgi:NAD(P)-dependent dehydrogenase (short-subunit alcohol dehydrogenase family)
MPEPSRTAVVTGASRGLGLETCRQLAAKGYAIVLTARDVAGVERGVSALKGARNIQGHVLDVASDQSVEAFFAWFKGQHASLDVLVNNAGRTFGSWGQTLADADAATMAQAIDNNALGAWRMIRHALPMMNAAGYGRIVNVTSGMGALTDMGGGSPAYRISKTALNAVTRIGANETKGNVRVNSVCPGWVRTDMGGKSASLSVEEGAAGIVWAATLADDGPNGGFFRHGKPLAW